MYFVIIKYICNHYSIRKSFYPFIFNKRRFLVMCGRIYFLMNFNYIKDAIKMLIVIDILLIK